MDITSSIPVVTGANRGLGRALVDALLERGVNKLYALARDPRAVREDARVIAVRCDLLDSASIAAAATRASDATLLINNASTAAFSGPLEADPAAVRHELTVNYEGLYETVHAFLPALKAADDAHVVNVLSLLSLASTPPMAGYSASKAAAHSLTQALRPVLGADGITVHGVYPAGIDTDMVAGIDVPKTAATDVAAGLLDGLAEDAEDIFPDPNARAMADVWWSDPKAFERAFSGVAA
jgi:NAD(P)-dependent dehydrogenase (short-subunit alcohol dehydrogenase family)